MIRKTVQKIVLLFLIIIPVQCYALSESEIAVCTGISNAMRDNGIGTDDEPVLVYYGGLFKGILKEHKQLPNNILENYTYGYKVGLKYTKGNLGDLYWNCIANAFK